MTQTQSHDKEHRAILQSLAHRAMIDRGLLPDFSAKALAELGRIQAPAAMNGEPDGKDHRVRDLRDLLWASIDNDDSRDLDQLTVAEVLPGDTAKILAALADVDSLVKKGSALDEYARHNTTSVYTAAMIFPMLPEKLSTNLTSLNLDEDRLAIVIEMVIGADGSLQASDIYRARVRNHAQLAYNRVAVWLEENGPMPEAVAAVEGLAENLRLQDRIAQRMRNLRHAHGALSLETIEAKPVFAGDQIRDLEVEEKNRATELIEDFMYDELGVLAKHLTEAEDAANKVERQVGKSAAALLLESRIGEQFDSIVTGASSKGTWVRLLHVPVESKLVQGFSGLDVGDRVRVQLIATNVERGYIDFKQVRSSRHG